MHTGSDRLLSVRIATRSTEKTLCCNTREQTINHHVAVIRHSSMIAARRYACRQSARAHVHAQDRLRADSDQRRLVCADDDPTGCLPSFVLLFEFVIVVGVGVDVLCV